MPPSAVKLVALVGLPAVGKSTLGRRLAALLGRTFYDTDQFIEAMTGRTVATIFLEEGESRFREMESQALEQIEGQRQQCVIATGGGIVLTERAREFLTDRAFAVYLRSPLPRLVARVSANDKRPLFHAGDIPGTLNRLHLERDPLYRSVAKLTVDTERKAMTDILSSIADRLPNGSADRAGPGACPDGH